MIRLVALALLLALTSACTPDARPPAPQSGFHTEVRHQLGTTVLDHKPLRVVALGPADLDTAVALGIRPVGVGLPLSQDIPPWVRDALPGWRPTTLRPGDSGYSAEAIAALHPDLILAGSDFTIDREYDQLSAIAPTTAFQTAPDEDSWQTTTRQAGAALGDPAGAERLVTATEDRIRRTSAAHPQLAGEQFAVTLAHAPGSLGVVRSARDVSVRTLSEFGMRIAPAAEQLPGRGFSAQLSTEQLAQLDTGVLITSYANPQLRSALETSPLFTRLNSVARGSYLACTADQWVALREPGVLSIPYLADHFIPDLAGAADHRPK